MNPKHQNPVYYREDSRGDTVEAVAPYNFVPLPEQVHQVDLPDSCNLDHYGKDGTHTGYIECSFTTKTPLYTRTAMTPAFYEKWGEKIRDLMKDPTARHDYAQFFQLKQGQPVIPGSSLRGMIRTVVEIISNSKMQWVTDEKLVFRAIGDRTVQGAYYRNHMISGSGTRMVPNVLAGHIEKNGSRWFIRPAQTIGGATFARIHVDDINNSLATWHSLKNAKTIWVKLSSLDFQDVQEGHRQLKYIQVTSASDIERSGYQKAVLVKGGEMPKKKREAVVFPPDETAPRIEISEKVVQRYKDQVSKAQADHLGHEYGALQDKRPIFYLLESNELVFFGHTMMFRLPYEKPPLEFVPPKLRDHRVTDLTEAVFGFVTADENDTRTSRAGRVSFCDAHLAEEQRDVWLNESPIIPKIMSGPKATSFQHYLTQQEPDKLRTSDPVKIRLDHYASPPPHETVIRGHKLYWHKAGANEEMIREPAEVNFQTDTQHTEIKPVREDVRFGFRIHFENLRDFELGALLWALTLPGEGEQSYCHKLGMGKALGMGSIHLTVDALHLSDRKARYQSLFAGDQWHTPETDQANGIAGYIAAFVERITGQAGRALHGDDRIRMLLKLLEYPGPSHDRTQYMGLGEFRERPVLPDPLHITRPLKHGLAEPRTDVAIYEEPVAVTAYSDAQEYVQGEEGKSIVAKMQARLSGRSTTNEDAPVQAGDTLKIEAKMPQTKDDFIRGAYVQVTVKDIQFNAVICETGVKDVRATLQIDRVVPPLEDEQLSDRFAIGQSLQVWVLSINRKGNVQLTLTKPE